MTSPSAPLRMLIAIAAVAVGGCALPPINVAPAPKPDFPAPQTVRWPARAAVYYSPEFSGSTIVDKTRDGLTYLHQPGAANVALFEQALGATFTHVERLQSFPVKDSIPDAVDVIVVPEIIGFYTIDNIPFQRIAKFGIRVFDKQMAEIDAWEISSTGLRSRATFFWPHESVYLAIYRQAAAQLLSDLSTREKLVARFSTPVAPTSTEPPLTASTSFSILYATARSAENDSDEENFVDCMAFPLSQNAPEIKLVAPRITRDALFPWFEPSLMPRERDEMIALVGRSVVRKAAAAAGIRYLGLLQASTINARPNAVGFCEAGCIGVLTYVRTTHISLHVWDLERNSFLGTLESSDEGRAVWAAFVLPFPIVPPARTEGTACQKAAEALRPLLSQN